MGEGTPEVTLRAVRASLLPEGEGQDEGLNAQFQALASVWLAASGGSPQVRARFDRRQRSMQLFRVTIYPACEQRLWPQTTEDVSE
jgi:hypothetical protein